MHSNKSNNILNFGVITISDRSSQGEREDVSGPVLQRKIETQGWKVNKYTVIPDNLMEISHLLQQWADHKHLDVILTTGGTGFSPRDVTPEATRAIIERIAPGIAEAMRYESLKITPHAMLSRAVAGIRKQTLIINLPGSPKAAVENLEIIIPVLPHAVELLSNNPHSEKGHQLTEK